MSASEQATEPDVVDVRWWGRPLRTWLRRIGLGLVGLLVAVTIVSVVFNWVTEPPRQLAPGFGSYVRVADADVHYQQWGEHGSPIVLVPGAMESSIVWSAVGPLLGRNHRVYAVDMGWHGYTRDPGSMTLQAQASLLEGYLSALHLVRPLLVGHSLGVAVIARVALDHPSSVGGVVFADGDALPVGSGPQWIQDVFRELLVHTPYLTSIIRIGEHWAWAAHGAIKSLCGSPCPGLTYAIVDQWIRPLDQQSEVDAIHRWLVAGNYGLTNAQVAAISVPSEIIWGSGDSIGGSLPATIANLHRPPVYIIKHANHLTMLADPAGFAAAVEAARVRS